MYEKIETSYQYNRRSTSISMTHNTTINDLSEDKIKALLQYFDTSLARSDLLASSIPCDTQMLQNILNDRANDISILSSVCQNLLQSNKSLRADMNRFREIQLKSTHKNSIGSSIVQNDNYFNLDTVDHVSASPINSHINTVHDNTFYCEKSVEELYSKNDEYINRMFTVSRTRESCEEYERSLVDRIVEELIRKRKETTTMTNTITDYLKDFLNQQKEISDLLIKNIQLRKKCKKLNKSNKEYKKQIKTLTVSKADQENKHDTLKSYNKIVQENTTAMQGKELVGRGAVEAYQGKLEIESELNFSDSTNSQHERQSSKVSSIQNSYFKDIDSSKFSTRKIVDVKGNERIQVVKTNDGSNMMKKWKQLSQKNTDDGFNQLLSDKFTPRNFMDSKDNQLISSPIDQNLLSGSVHNLDVSHPIESNIPTSSNEGGDVTVTSNISFGPNYIYRMENVSKTMSQYGMIPHSQNKIIDPPKPNTTESSSYSIFNTISKMFG